MPRRSAPADIGYPIWVGFRIRMIPVDRIPVGIRGSRIPSIVRIAISVVVARIIVWVSGVIVPIRITTIIIGGSVIRILRVVER